MSRQHVTLGIDLSTQSATGVILVATTAPAVASEGSADGCIRSTIVDVAAEESVNFDSAFPQYGTAHGVQRRGAVTTSPVAMWLDALDLLLRRLRERYPSALLARIEGISVSAQQHATVLVSDAAAFVASRGREGLACPDARVWMDDSTEEDRRRFLSRIGHGGDDYVRATTGARAELRYVAAQVMGVERLTPGLVSKRTSTVHLCSSALTALLSGSADCPVDRGDASGTNLFDLTGASWSAPLVEATGVAELASKLPQVAVDGDTVVSEVASAWVADALFGVDVDSAATPPRCRVVVGTGDNPASLVGCFASTGGVASVSLGTSDTVCIAAPDAATALRRGGAASSSDCASNAMTTTPLELLAAAPCVMGNAHPGATSAAVFAMGCLTQTGGAVAREALARKVANRDGGAGIDHCAVEAAAWRCVQGADASTLLETAKAEAAILAVAAVTDDAAACAARAKESAPLRYVGLVLVQAACLALSIRDPDGDADVQHGTIFVTGGGSRSAFLCCVVAIAFKARSVRRLRASGNTAALGAAIRALAGGSPGCFPTSTTTVAPSAGLVEEFAVGEAIAAAVSASAKDVVADKVAAALDGLLLRAPRP